MKRVNIADPEFELDPGDPPGFRSGLVRLGKLLGSEDSGISVYDLPPGQAVCPYHYEVGEEEWLIVLSGHPTLRHPGGSEKLDPWDAVRFPKGPDGAHGVRNETDDSARVLFFSTVVIPTATVYPDSDKVGIWTGDPNTTVMVRRESNVEYFDGER
ncbi:MAG TPA: cupin domain-containing protein [Solirubrobacterales bacterium]|jgi:uncharacterized cupin superfamily protein